MSRVCPRSRRTRFTFPIEPSAQHASHAATRPPSHPTSQVRLAVTALLKHLAASAAASGRKDLLGDDARQPIHLSVHLKKLPGRASNKPVRM